MTARTITRLDTSTVGRWWWTVDKWMLAATIMLVAIGILLNLAAGPPAADRIGAGTFFFVRKQMVFLPLALLAMFAVSLLAPVNVRRLAAVGFLLSGCLMLLTLIVGDDINGARRWLSIGPLHFGQPSEFVKPFFAVVAAWMFAEHKLREDFPGNLIALGMLLAVVAILLSQPDIGMTLVVSAVWCAQFFIAGLPIFWVILIIITGLAAIVGAYFSFSHVASRVDRFLDPSSGDTYQVSQAMRAFQQGGLFGRGPGEGRVKEALPDAHTDFIFAVAGEEFGAFLCLLIVALFAFIVIRALTKVMREENMFVLLAVGGLAVQFGLQAMINMASSLHMMPTKGMTLPFISYGGSSLVALGVATGMILALTRRRRDLEGRSI
jgi:cell division protein FtsW